MHCNDSDGKSKYEFPTFREKSFREKFFGEIDLPVINTFFRLTVFVEFHKNSGDFGRTPLPLQFFSE